MLLRPGLGFQFINQDHLNCVGNPCNRGPPPSPPHRRAHATAPRAKDAPPPGLSASAAGRAAPPAHTRPGNYPAQPSGVSVSTRDTSPFEKSDTDIGGDGWSFEHQQLEYRCNYGLLTSLGSSEVAKFSPWEMELVGVGETDGVRQAAVEIASG